MGNGETAKVDTEFIEHKKRFSEGIRMTYVPRAQRLWGTFKMGVKVLPLSRVLFRLMFFSAYFLLVALLFSIPSASAHWLTGGLKLVVSVLGVFTSFILSFYVNICYDRYREVFKCVFTLEGRVREASRLIASSIGYLGERDVEKEKKCQAIRLNIVRYLSLAHHCVFKEMFNDDNYQHLQNLKLINNEELDKIHGSPADLESSEGLNPSGKINNHKYMHCLNWALQEAIKAKKQGLVLDDNLLIYFNQILGQLRANAGGLYDFSSNPIPFVYHWLVQVVSFIFLLALPLGLVNDEVSAWSILLPAAISCSIIYIMLLVADELSYPFIGSSMSLDINRSVSHTLMCCLEYIRPDLCTVLGNGGGSNSTKAKDTESEQRRCEIYHRIYKYVN